MTEEGGARAEGDGLKSRPVFHLPRKRRDTQFISAQTASRKNVLAFQDRTGSKCEIRD